MAIPDYQSIMMPLLKVAADGQDHTYSKICDYLAQYYNLTDEELKESLPNSRRTKFRNRVGLALKYLVKAGLLDSPRRGAFAITDRGLEVYNSGIEKLDDSFLQQYPEFVRFQKEKGNPIKKTKSRAKKLTKILSLLVSIALIVIFAGRNYWPSFSKAFSIYYGEYWGLTLIFSALLTWGIGLAPPLLIRFAILRRSMNKGWAIGTVVFCGVMNLMLFIALGSKSKTHFALFLIAYASYAILRKEGKKQIKRTAPATEKELKQAPPINKMGKGMKDDYRSLPKGTVQRTGDNTWKIALALVCLAILGYGFFYSKNTIADPARLFGSNLPYTLIIWGVFYAAVARKRGVRIGGFSFLAIFICMIASGLIGYSQQKHEAKKALPEPQNQYSALIESSTDSQGFPKRIPNASGSIEYVKEISQTYAYCFGQYYSLDNIKNKFPLLKNDVFKVTALFDMNFKLAYQKTEEFLKLISKDGWREHQQNLISQIESISHLEQITIDQAVAFLEVVERRAKGDIESPVLETLLSFHPTFLKHPEEEFFMDFKNIYRTKGHPKAEGLDVQIEFPKSWKKREGKRPHVVQFFRNQYGHGAVMMSLIIRALPHEIAKELTDEDIKLLFANKNEVEAMAPKGAKVLNSKSVILDNQNGAMIVFETTLQRIDLKHKMLTHQYMTMYDKKYIILSMAARDTSGDSEGLNKIYEKHKKLFWLIANSLIIQNQYLK